MREKNYNIGMTCIILHVIIIRINILQSKHSFVCVCVCVCVLILNKTKKNFFLYLQFSYFVLIEKRLFLLCN